MNLDSFIRCRGLTREYRRGPEAIRPIDQLDLDVPAGEFLALMGPSGSGKSTLLHLLAGVDRPTAGRVEIGGVAVNELSRHRLAAWRARNVGFIFQLYHLVPSLTAFENVELPLLLAPLSRRERRARVEAALEAVGLSDRMRHFPRELSGGQEQRVAIARAIVHDPPLLLADEPTGDLDRRSATAILDLLRSLGRRGRTIVLVTHDPRAAEVADRVLHLDKGRLLEAPA